MQIEDRALAAVPCSADGDGLRRVRLAPWGRIESLNGTFTVDDEGCKELVAAFNKHGVSLPIDVEHETLAGKEPATGARGAVGWIESLEVEAGRGLFALARWSDRARDLIRADAFRYLSPVFWIQPGDRKVVGIHSAALTTTPAIAKMDRLAASSRAKESDTNMAQNANVEKSKSPNVGMGGDEGTEGRRDEGKDSAIACAVRARLGLKDDASPAEVTVALSLLGSEGEATKELLAMKQAEQRRQALERIAYYTRLNVLNPNDAAQTEAAEWLAMNHPERLEALLASCKPYAPPGKTVAPSSRSMLIAKVVREWRGETGLQKLCSALKLCQPGTY